MHPCLNCHADLTAALASGATVCPACAHPIGVTGAPPPPRMAIPSQKRQTHWWLWVVFTIFLVGPPAIFLALAGAKAGKQTNEVLTVLLLAGSVLAGGTLARLVARGVAQFILCTVIFSIAFLVVNGGLALFVGCVAFLGKR